MCNETWKQTLLDAGIRHRGRYYATKRVQQTLDYLSSSGPLLIEYRLLSSLRAMGFELDPLRDNKSVADVDALVGKLARYGKPLGMSLADAEALDLAKKATRRAFGSGGSLLTPLPLDERLADNLQLSRSSGLPELRPKVECFSRDLKRAARVEEGTKTPAPCMAFRRIQHGESGPATRLVWGYPSQMTIIESRFAPLLIERFLEWSTPMTIGLGKIQVGARMVKIRNKPWQYGLDFSGFDASVPVGLIHFAFRVLSEHFEFDENARRAWDRITNYFIHTPVVLPDGELYQVNGGVPSGSYFTQLIDSVVNYCVVQYIHIRMFGKPLGHDDVLVLGDDAIFGAYKMVNLDSLAEYARELGFVLNKKKTTRTQSKPGYLGHVWPTCLPDRSAQEVAMRLAFPEKASGIKDPRLRQLVRLLSMVGDSQSVGHEILYKMAPYKGPNIRRRFYSLLDLFEVRGQTSVMTDLTVIPGWRVMLERLGVEGALNLDGLIGRQPFVGLAS